MRTVPALGRWASIDQLLPSEAHCVLARDRAADLVEQYLEQYASPGWRRRERLGLLPEGWRLYTDVFVESPPGEEIPEEVASLVPSAGERPTLRGGLRLPGGLHTYLVGGEPDLWVPPRRLGGDIEVVLNDENHAHERIVHRLPPEGGHAPLHALGLGSGSHTLRIGPSTLFFQTVDTINDVAAADAGGIGHELVVNGETYAPTTPGATRLDEPRRTGRVRVFGALINGDGDDLPPAVRPPLIALNRDEEFILLGTRPGQIQRGQRPTAPEWPEGLDLRPIGYEVYPDFEPAWILRRTTLGGLRASRRSSADPTDEPIGGASEAQVTDWASQFLREATLENDDDKAAWARFAEIARGLGR
jgi:hypothetical protein